MNKAIFLDRDGVINRKGSSYYIFREEEFLFNQGVFDALKDFISREFKLIVITNQGGISKKIFTVAHLEKLHKFMIDQLKANGIELTDIYYCPHHPDNELCRCRKPGTLLFERALKKHKIDPAESYMIGDSEADIRAAEKMGMKGILMPTNGNMMDIIKTEKI